MSHSVSEPDSPLSESINAKARSEEGKKETKHDDGAQCDLDVFGIEHFMVALGSEHLFRDVAEDTVTICKEAIRDGK